MLRLLLVTCVDRMNRMLEWKMTNLKALFEGRYVVQQANQRCSPRSRKLILRLEPSLLSARETQNRE
jgi:hypothetical protein